MELPEEGGFVVRLFLENSTACSSSRCQLSSWPWSGGCLSLWWVSVGLGLRVPLVD